MARTLTEIVTALAADPANAELADDINGERVVLSATQRTARLTEWARTMQADEQETEAETERRTLRAEVRLALTTLATDLAEANADSATLTGAAVLTQAQLRAALARCVDRQRHLERAVAGLVRVLIDRALIERDESE